MEMLGIRSRMRQWAALAVAAALAGSVVVVTQGGAPASAGSQQVKLLGTGFLKQDASPGGATASLLSLNGGALQHRAVCTSLGGGANRLRILVRSDKVGGRAFTRLGHLGLDTTWRELWVVEGPGTYGLHESYEVLYKDGTARLFELTFAVNHGKDCVSRIVATTA